MYLSWTARFAEDNLISIGASLERGPLYVNLQRHEVPRAESVCCTLDGARGRERNVSARLRYRSYDPRAEVAPCAKSKMTPPPTRSLFKATPLPLSLPLFLSCSHQAKP